MHKNIINDFALRRKATADIKLNFPLKSFVAVIKPNKKLFVPKRTGHDTIMSCNATVPNVQTKKKNYFQEERFKKARLYQALWLVMGALPSNQVSNVYYNKFLSKVEPNFNPMSRQTESREEQIMFCWAVIEINRRINLAWEFFKAPFMSIQCGDGWTSDSNMDCKYRFENVISESRTSKDRKNCC